MKFILFLILATFPSVVMVSCSGVKKPHTLRAKTQFMLDSSESYLEAVKSTHTYEDSFKCYKDYLDKVKEYLSPSLNKLLLDHYELRKQAQIDGHLVSRYDKWIDDLILLRRWSPDHVQIAQVSTGESKNRVWYEVAEVLKSAKIYTGYRGKLKIIFIWVDGEMLINDVVTKRKYESNDRTETLSLRNRLEDAIRRYKK